MLSAVYLVSSASPFCRFSPQLINSAEIPAPVAGHVTSFRLVHIHRPPRLVSVNDSRFIHFVKTLVTPRTTAIPTGTSTSSSPRTANMIALRLVVLAATLASVSAQQGTCEVCHLHYYHKVRPPSIPADCFAVIEKRKKRKAVPSRSSDRCPALRRTTGSIPRGKLGL